MTHPAKRAPATAAAVVVRAATHEDLEDLLGLAAILEELQRPWRVFVDRKDPMSEARARLLAAIADPDTRVAVADEAGQVIGMGVGRIAAMSTSSDERSLDLSQVVVLPGRRERGVGRAIVDDLVTFGRARDVRLVSLRVFSPNTEATAFWSSLGLRPRFVQMVGEVRDL